MAESWLQSSRAEAEERFRALPYPGERDENFRFMPSLDAVKGAGTGAPVEGEASKTPLGPDEGEAALLALEGGRELLLGAAEGITLTGLASAATGSHAKHLRATPFADDKFAQLTLARWTGGAFLHVAAGRSLTSPVRVLSRPGAGEEHQRHLVVLEDGAEAVLIQECRSGEEARVFGELTEVRLGKGSRLHWVQVQALGSSCEAFLRQKVELAEGAELRFTPLHLGGKTVQLRQEVELLGHGAFFETQGAARGTGAQHFDFWLNVRHLSPGSRSKMDYWFVMDGKARGVFNGLIDIPAGSAGCESSQKAKSLLLGSGTVHAIPKLLIATDDVKCSHGASVSSVSFEQLHYLQSRGIPREEAERMIVSGFTEPVVERLPTVALQERAEAWLEAKSEGGLQ